ncbi:MAG: dihydrolipoyl dehydrogenase [Deltaproteobacteria bacterium HGW-Deltaproteobacteria-13]|jgi:dihydrolipoamide dehydrogenase|nr:MAG: dihydrolipoyl dehydrogenase [Deltaproteobacteria bacterium HGW-Deltaproteobacteria-13]
MSEKYDLIIIGGGPGGIAAAEVALAKKKKVLIIEKNGWGGTCTHRGCIPTKALLSCSKHYADLKKLKRMGINIAEASVDFSAIKKHQQQIVKVSSLGAQKVLTEAGGEIRQGAGEIISPSEVRFTDASGKSETISTQNIIIAWGSVPQILPGINLSERILTSDGILNLNVLPSSMIIVGGSVIGVEFATFFAELGTKVTIVEILDRIIPLEDQECADLLRQELIGKGVVILTSTKLESLKDTGESVFMAAQKDGKQLEVSADYALLCTGRKALLHSEELDKLGIEYTKAGIKVDKNMMTNVAGIYAVGDVTGGMMLAHRASKQAKYAIDLMYEVGDSIYNEDFIPSVVYGHPQIARVGFTQKRAEEEGLSVEVVKSPYSANIIARAELMGQGFVKAFFYQDKMIGATIVGEDAADLITPLALAVSNGMTKKQLRNWVIPHPALSEIFTSITG